MTGNIIAELDFMNTYAADICCVRGLSACRRLTDEDGEGIVRLIQGGKAGGWQRYPTVSPTPEITYETEPTDRASLRQTLRCQPCWPIIYLHLA